MPLSSVSGLISILDDSASQAQLYALKAIHDLIDRLWPEIASYLPRLKKFTDTNQNFPDKDLVFSIFSRIHYHLKDTALSFEYATNAGKYFDPSDNTLYSQTLIEYAIGTFLRHSNNVHNHRESALNPHISSIILDYADRMVGKGDFSGVIGLATESSNPQFFMLSLGNCLKAVTEKHLKRQIFEIALESSHHAAKDVRPILARISTFYGVRFGVISPLEYADLRIKNGAAEELTDLLTALISGFEVNPYLLSKEVELLNNCQKGIHKIPKSEIVSVNSKEVGSIEIRDMNEDPNIFSEYELFALQIAFDIAETTDRQLIKRVVENLMIPFYCDDETVELAGTKIKLEEILENAANSGASFNVEKSLTALNETKQTFKKLRENGAKITKDDLIKISSHFFPEHFARATTIRRILTGHFLDFLQLQFLYGACKRGAAELGAVLQSVGNKNPISTGALIIAHGFARCGTAQDGFVRRNTSWFAECSNWTKFSAVASLGVVHKGNALEFEKLLKAHLPQNGVRRSPYQEGGALFAAGLMHSGHGTERLDFFVDALKKSDGNEIVQNGACLGIGSATIGFNDDSLNDSLKEVLFKDNCIASQSAAIAIGLNSTGNNNSPIAREMLEYAHQTKHEKIVRGIVIGVALTCLSAQDKCDPLINEMLSDENEIIRYGGCFALGLAFAGNEDMAALKKLLEIAAGDISGDVRRAAIMSIAFVLCRVPKKVPGFVRLFAESFNPHSRYGAAMAIGIACAGTSMDSALKILSLLTKDKIDFVRNAALMAKSLVFAQTTSSQKSRVEEHIQEISKYIKNTSSGDFPSFSKSGAILSMGLLTLGGNNCTVSMLSDNGHKSLFGGDNGNIIRPVAVAGVLLFMQSWHWYPFNHFLSLAVKPTAFIGITSALKMPKHFRLFCRNAQNYEFPEFKLEEEKKKTEASEVTLSISEKSKLERYRRRSKNKKSGLLQKSSAIASTKKLGDDTVASSKAVPSPGAVSSTGEETTASSSNAKPSTDAVSSTREEAMKKNGIASADKKDEKEKSKEEETALKVEKALKNCVLKNPCRITIKQRKEVGEFVQQRYCTIKKGFGVILLKDNCPKDPEDLATNKYIHGKNM